MPEKDTFADQRRAKEEEFIYRKEQELLAKLREKSAAESERREMAQALGADDEIAALFQELGFTKDTVVLAPIVPLLQVAWADGAVSPKERREILEVAKLHRIAEGSASHGKLLEWFDRKPKGEFFEKVVRVVQHLIASLPDDKRSASTRDLVSYCTRIATASGGFLGLGHKISPEENAAIEEIVRGFEFSHAEGAKDVLKGS